MNRGFELETAMRGVASVLVLTAALFSGTASAEPLHSTEDIVEYFSKAADLGATRGICVGTEEECAAKSGTSAPAGLDMLINFDLNSSELTPEARTKLEEFAKALKDSRLNSHSFVVEGHTDASGSEDYNIGLSERRAHSVSAFLLASGIEPSRISAAGRGEGNPRVADPFDPTNRRVEMRINLQ